MLHRKVHVSVDKEAVKPAGLPSHFYPRKFPEVAENPLDLREVLEASDPVFRPIVVDAIPVLARNPTIDRVHVYRAENLPCGASSLWPMELLFVESNLGQGHVWEHDPGDYNWASEIDDADTIVLGFICEAVHQSLPCVSWEDFMKILEGSPFFEFKIDWLAEEDDVGQGKILWVRFGYKDQGGKLFWGLTWTRDWKIKSNGFMPVNVIELKKREEKDELLIMGMMDDLVLEPSEINE